MATPVPAKSAPSSHTEPPAVAETPVPSLSKAEWRMSTGVDCPAPGATRIPVPQTLLTTLSLTTTLVAVAVGATSMPGIGEAGDDGVLDVNGASAEDTNPHRRRVRTRQRCRLACR
ncbi:MAG: hypothetical protein V9G10_05610 [Candidatus Nanopelagicales bacterium]